MSSRLSHLLLAALLLIVPACGKKLSPTQSTAPISADVLERPAAEPEHGRRRGAAQILGERNGAKFGLFRPENWNGILVVYAHGFTAPNRPIELPLSDHTLALRDGVLSRGYAFAYSSWSENGFAVKDAIQHTDELRHLFADRLGKPRRTFLVGHSLGGLAALALAEGRGGSRGRGRGDDRGDDRAEHRGDDSDDDRGRDRGDDRAVARVDGYDGALLLSGILGGSRREIAYIANVRVLFDYFYPGVLPGDLLHLPKGLDVNRDVIGPAIAAIQQNPQGALAMSQIVQTPIPFRDANELVRSIIEALAYQAIELEDLLARTQGRSFFDNQRTVYSGPLPAPLLTDLNARVARHRITPAVAEFFKRFYEPTGEIRIPILALHTAFDPVVPVFNETLYRERVAKEHNSRWLVQRIIPRYGHVGYTPEEMIGAFEELVRWAKTGRRPTETPAPHALEEQFLPS